MWYEVKKGHHWGHGDGRVDGPGLVEIEDGVDVSMFVPWKLAPVADQAAPEQAEDLVPWEDAPEGEEDALAAPEDAPDDYWADLPERLIDTLEENGIAPDELPGMADRDLLAIKGIGDTYLAEIRLHYPKA